ncbi:hypothetical protein [Rhodococcus opacus]|uniref:hypothetical protein n=1 Tax=Rhodococcus opacus TaxID=37919 RepID=UPI0034D2A715
MNHDSIRAWVAQQIGVDLDTAGAEQLAAVFALTARAEALYVHTLLDLPDFRPCTG